MDLFIRPIRVVLADDTQHIVDQVSGLLKHHCEILGIAQNGQEAVQLTMALLPDILILDISMPILSGIEVARRLQQLGKTAIVFLTCHDDSDYVNTAFSLGALGYVLKHHMTNDLVPAINAALRGDRFLSVRSTVCLQ